MRVLVACEESQRVTKEFRKRGHEAYSCDLLPCGGGRPEWHIQADALEIVKMKWDMVLAFPPCTHLAVSGARHFNEKRKDGRQYMGIGFFMAFTALQHVPMVAIENPVGIMSNVYRKPDQIIQPWQFGDNYEKTTCLWLKGLPLLIPQVKEKPKMEFIEWQDKKTGRTKRQAKWYYEAMKLPPNERAMVRSKTFIGVARAMAEQWGSIETLVVSECGNGGNFETINNWQQIQFDFGGENG